MQAARDVFDRLEPLRVRVRAKTALAEPLEHLELAVEVDALAGAGAVDPGGERPLRGDRRVLLPERACGRVPRVRRELLARPGKALVQLAEAGQRQVDLSANLDDRRRVVAVHPQRDRLDRPQVRRHVLALDAVAASRAANEQPFS